MATTCKHKIGLLSLRDCKAPATVKCQICGRPVCDEHQRTLTNEQTERVLCMECFLARDNSADATESFEYQRRELYRSASYQPLYYGRSQRYGKEDYEYFDRESGAGFGAAAAGGMMDAMMDAEDMMSAEDFQDS